MTKDNRRSVQDRSSFYFFFFFFILHISRSLYFINWLWSLSNGNDGNSF